MISFLLLSIFLFACHDVRQCTELCIFINTDNKVLKVIWLSQVCPSVFLCSISEETEESSERLEPAWEYEIIRGSDWSQSQLIPDWPAPVGPPGVTGTAGAQPGQPVGGWRGPSQPARPGWEAGAGAELSLLPATSGSCWSVSRSARDRLQVETEIFHSPQWGECLGSWWGKTLVGPHPLERVESWSQGAGGLASDLWPPERWTEAERGSQSGSWWLARRPTPGLRGTIRPRATVEITADNNQTSC